MLERWGVTSRFPLARTWRRAQMLTHPLGKKIEPLGWEWGHRRATIGGREGHRDTR